MRRRAWITRRPAAAHFFFAALRPAALTGRGGRRPTVDCFAPTLRLVAPADARGRRAAVDAPVVVPPRFVDVALRALLGLLAPDTAAPRLVVRLVLRWPVR